MGAGDSDEEREERGGGNRFERVITRVLLLCLAILVIQFGLWGFRRFGPAPPSPALSRNELRVGTQFPVTGSVDLSGNSIELRPAEPGNPATIIVVLTTTCPFCRTNVPIWNSIHRSVSGQLRFIALSLDDLDRTQRFIETSRAEFPLLVVEDARSFIADLGMHSVPQTLALDAEGVIQQVWGGGLSEEHVAVISQSMGELVPGLQVAR